MTTIVITAKLPYKMSAYPLLELIELSYITIDFRTICTLRFFIEKAEISFNNSNALKASVLCASMILIH